MGKTRAYNLRTQQSPSYRRGEILWLMRDNNIKWAVNKHTSIEAWVTVAALLRTTASTNKHKCPLLLYGFKRSENYGQIFHARCVWSSGWQALIPRGSSGMCSWLCCWMGSFCVKGQFLMLYLDKLYFKVPVTIYHALWVIRLYGALGLVWVWLLCRLGLRTCVAWKYDTAFQRLYLPPRH